MNNNKWQRIRMQLNAIDKCQLSDKSMFTLFYSSRDFYFVRPVYVVFLFVLT